MLTLIKNDSNKPIEARARHSRLAAALSVMWEAEMVSLRTLEAIAKRVEDPKHAVRLRVLADFGHAHASRLLARIAAMGRGPLPVVREIEAPGDLPSALRNEAAFRKCLDERCKILAQVARDRSDLSTAWVCQLNCDENNENADELLTLAREME